MSTEPRTDHRLPGGSPYAPATASRSGSQATTGEMPVLFQLADLSRPRSQRPSQPSPPPASEASNLAELKLSSPPTSPRTEPTLAASVAAAIDRPASYAPAALDPATLWSPPAASLLTPPATSPVEAPSTQSSIASSGTATSPKSETTGSAAEPATATDASSAAPSAASENKPTPAERRDVRAEQAKRRQPTKSNDWFASHGKLIAVGFVAALIITVIIARNKSQMPVAETADNWSLNHPGGAADHLAGGGPTIELPPSGVELASETETSADDKAASPADKQAVAKSDDASESSSKTDLLPPTIPQQTIAEAPASSTAPPLFPAESFAKQPPAPPATPNNASGDSLFQWPQQETRVASRPESPATTAPAAATSPAAAPAGPRNPGEVINPYAPATTAAASAPATSTSPPPTTSGAGDYRSPYTLPSPQATTAPPAGGGSVYSQPPQQQDYSQGYPSTPAPSGYGAAPASPSPYTQPSGAYAPQQPAPAPTGNGTSVYGGSAYGGQNYGGQAYGGQNMTQPGAAPPAGYPNTQPSPNGYRYERTGSGLY